MGIDIAYMGANFDDSSVSRSGDMVSDYRNLNGSRDLTTPFQGKFAIHGLALATIDLFTSLYLYPV